MLKGYLIILFFTGQVYLQPFAYDVKSKDTDQLVMACTERADELRRQLSTHSWDNPKGQGWYLKNRVGTIQGHIC